MQVSATEAKNRFGTICMHAQTEPVFVAKDGCIDTVIISAKQYYQLQSSNNNSNLAKRQSEFDSTYKVWLAAQNQRFDQNGLWCDDLRVW
jgi:PHD/YefM family antitoxin component YafN of YafNO toxin-antitoxin module